MKPEKNIDDILEQYITSASKEDVDAHCDQVLQRLRRTALDASHAKSDSLPRASWAWRWTVIASAAAGVLVALSVTKGVLWRKSAPLAAVKSTSSEARVMMLSDGSRIEMRGGSEAAVENVVDGLRVRLKGGSIIVKAAKQAPGRHLYVETRDVVVSVVGTVFLVKADDRGTHVAVIEGEVHVQQGATEKQLKPGEQTSSNPKAETLPIPEEIGWSRDAAAYLAMLHQELAQGLAARQASTRSQSTPVVSDKPQFEEASVRPCPEDFQTPQGMRGGGSNSMRVSPGRLDALCMTAATLIRAAYRPLHNNSPFPGNQESTQRLDLTYGLGREDGTRVRGGPGWVRSEKYTIAAVAGKAVDPATLQHSMLLALLESRFQLKTHVEVEPIPVWALAIAKSGLKMKRAGRESCAAGPATATGFDSRTIFEQLESIRRGEPPWCGLSFQNVGPNIVHLGGAMSIGSLASQLTAVSQELLFVADLDRLLILDRTGVPDTDTFNFVLQYAADEEAGARGGIRPGNGAGVPRAPGIFDALEQQLGLKLERAQGTREFVVIDQIERPSEN
jgi:uncharacterized protein (TIGR03435 family)